MKCRGCGRSATDRVLDLGRVPAADFFPLASTPVSPNEASHPLAMELCRDCGLAQLAQDDTTTQEPRGVEPQALKNQAAEAVRALARAGWLRGDTVAEFGSPHGGSWLPLLTERGYHAPEPGAPADVVIDCFSIMHEADQRGAFEEPATAAAPNGTLLIQFHSLHTIVRQGQWNALRHGHFAYYSLTALMRLLARVGMHVAAAWEFPLYDGTVMVAARRRRGPHLDTTDATTLDIVDAEGALGIDRPSAFGRLQHAADRAAASLGVALESMTDVDRRVYGYGAASRTVALFSRAGIRSRHLAAVADASPAKQGRRMPGTDIPIISPEQLVEAHPYRVLLTLPDLLPEVQRRLPQLHGRWVVDWTGADRAPEFADRETEFADRNPAVDYQPKPT